MEHAALIGPMLIACAAIVALLLVWTPLVVHAQSASAAAASTQPAGTYVVRKRTGESLRDIALLLYNDSTRWKDLAAANRITAQESRAVCV